MSKILLMGTTHEIQEKDYQRSGEFKRVLSYLCQHYGINVIMEEWTSLKGDTIGRLLAIEQGIDWVNVGTPPIEDLGTFGPLFDPREDPPMLINRYGPLNIQICREDLMMEAIRRAMIGMDMGLMVLGMAHLHSLSEKLTQSGFEVEGFHWTVPAMTLEF